MRARARGLLAGTLPVAVMAVIVAGAPPARAAGPGTISTVAGGPGRGLVHNVAQEANWVATAPDGSVYVSDVQGGSGNLLIADDDNGRIREVTG